MGREEGKTEGEGLGRHGENEGKVKGMSREGK